MPNATTRARTTTQENELSYDIKFLLVILLLFVMYPVGLILMWVWMPHWPTWLKLLISLPVLLGIFLCFVGMALFVGLLHRGFENRQMIPYYRSYYRGYYQNFPQRNMMYQYQQQAPTETPAPTSDEVTPTPY